MEGTRGSTGNGTREAGREVEGRESVREGDTWSITFWNVAGIRNKDKDLGKIKRMGCTSSNGNMDRS